MNPKHHNPTMPRRGKAGTELWARAPYNFVPLPERVVVVESIPPQDAYSGHTGYIQCTLTTKSPLYVRSAMTPEFFRESGEKKFHELSEVERNERARFFFLEDPERPVIPGSSLRGMIRTLVEIAGYGKMNWVTGNPLVFRAVGDTTSLGKYYSNRLLRDDGGKRSTPLMRAGYIEKQEGRWFIRPAQQIDGTTFARIEKDMIADAGRLTPWYGCRNASRVWVKVGTYDYQPVPGGFVNVKYTPVLKASGREEPDLRQAVVARSGPMASKKMEAVVFPPDESAQPIEIDEELVSRYRGQISPKQEELLGEGGVLRPNQPVFYLIEDGLLVFFGHAMMFRLPYDRSTRDFVPASLRKGTTVDMAEGIFGYVPESISDKRDACAGRVFFTDGEFRSAKNEVWLSSDVITPKILSSPKATTFQHYLTQQQPDEVDSGRRDRSKMELRLDHYASPPPHNTIIRGHKLYWHKDQIGLDDIEEKDQDKIKRAPKQYTRIRPINQGVTLEFRIYFDNLLDQELGALLWVLTLPGDAGKQYCQKLGMGKPLGMGAVEIEPRLHLADRKTRYEKLFDNEQWFGGDPIARPEAEFISAFEKYVLERMDPGEKGQARRLAEVERIGMLLKILEWPGPSRDFTEYMVIEPVNEYQKRPVLPDPMNIRKATGKA